MLAPFSAAAENIMAKFRNRQMVDRKLNYFSLQIFSIEQPTVVTPNHDQSSKQDKLFGAPPVNFCEITIPKISNIHKPVKQAPLRFV